MAISIRYSTTDSDYKTLLGLSFGAAAEVDDVIVVCLACDSDAEPYQFVLQGTGSVYLTPVQAVTATNTGNTICSIYYAVVTSVPDNLTGIAVNGLAETDAKAGSVYVISGLDTTSPLDKTASSTGASASPSSGATATLSQADEIAIGAVGMEHDLASSSGSWTTGAGYVSGNELTDGTNENGSTANQVIRSAAEIVNATTAQTAQITGEDSKYNDFAACIATFKAEGGAPPPAEPSLLMQMGIG